MIDIWMSIGHFFGLDNLSGPFYGWWSGAGSDLTEIFGPAVAFFAWYRLHTCHVDSCWWFGRHKVEGTAYSTCRKHHPTVPEKITHEHILAAHAAANPDASND